MGSVPYREAQSLPDSSQMTNLRHSMPHQKNHQPRSHGYRTGDNSAAPKRGSSNPAYVPNDFQRVMAQIETPDEEYEDMEDTNLPTYGQWAQYLQPPSKAYQTNLSQSQQNYRSSLYPVNNSKQQMNHVQSVPHQKQSEPQHIPRFNYNYNQ